MPNDDPDRRTSVLEKHVQTIIQVLVLGGIVWLTSSTIEFSKALIRIEVRSEAATATAVRVETKIGAVEAQLQVMERNIQEVTFKQDDLDRRMKGLELMRERLK